MGTSSITASAIMSYTETLEEQTASLYERMAEKFGRDSEVLQKFAKDSEKNKVLLVRTYQETISDALEATFSFEGLELIEYNMEGAVAEGTNYREALEIALKTEEDTAALYTKIAELSRSLLATIPRAFDRVAKKRKQRMEVLQELIDNA
jgi:rubrerythrin